MINQDEWEWWSPSILSRWYRTHLPVECLLTATAFLKDLVRHTVKTHSDLVFCCAFWLVVSNYKMDETLTTSTQKLYHVWQASYLWQGKTYPVFFFNDLGPNDFKDIFVGKNIGPRSKPKDMGCNQSKSDVSKPRESRANVPLQQSTDREGMKNYPVLWGFLSNHHKGPY